MSITTEQLNPVMGDPDYPSIHEVLRQFLNDEADAGELEGYVCEMHQNGTEEPEEYTPDDWLLICAVGFEVHELFANRVNHQQLRIAVKRLVASHAMVNGEDPA